MKPYEEFLEEKVAFDEAFGFDVRDVDLHRVLKPHQRDKMGRRGSGAELNPGYWRDSVRYLRSEEMRLSAPTLFDVLGGESA